MALIRKSGPGTVYLSLTEFLGEKIGTWRRGLFRGPIVLTLGCIMLSACIGESTPDSYGVVAGHLQMVGGPAHVTIPVAGSITIQGDAERTVEVG
jgi:hypothetical protein